MESAVINKIDLGDGYTVEQLQNTKGDLYYRVCHSGLCRYCEDEYYAYVYAAQMGWSPE